MTLWIPSSLPGISALLTSRLLEKVILSDMSEPWMQLSDLYKSGMNNTYLRMMNTSGIPFRDHTGSMVIASPKKNPSSFAIPFFFSPHLIGLQ